MNGIAFKRSRLSFLAMALLTIGVGLVVHWRGGAVSPALRDKLGDALWAMMMAWWVGVAAPRATWQTRAAAAFGISVAVEVSQLYHAPFIDMVRRTTLGGLALGSGFDLRDIAAYAVGIALAVVVERLLTPRTGR
ncbi:MAG TPA: DUF2809 domain-containing protein [Gemmatimonadaceae bacterium]|nr:DUF2809 domain-containing protein [Gemmatimonadaceae bacterium]